MGCGTCGNQKSGEPSGCQSKGNCSTGGCNRLNTYNWLADLPNFGERDSFNIVEVSYKNGSRKGFHRNYLNAVIQTGDTIVVETNYGQDIGQISLSGELVRLQMRKKRIDEDSPKITKILRLATEQDLERATIFREEEPGILLHSRVISRDMNMNMKISDVEYQGDGRKITFYYTAEDRVDFRELIKVFAREFKVRVEMCQIGPRQEAGKLGGIGSCGRELCCSTWLTSFKTVHTSVARYQNLAINQSKLSGQCGRLKCCLNYELDSYLDALRDFPKKVDFLETKKGRARLVKTDIFKRKMWYALPQSPLTMLSLERVKHIKEMNVKGEVPESLLSEATRENRRMLLEENKDDNHIGKVEEIDLPNLKKNKKRSRNRNRSRNREGTDTNRPPRNRKTTDKPKDAKAKKTEAVDPFKKTNEKKSKPTPKPKQMPDKKVDKTNTTQSKDKKSEKPTKPDNRRQGNRRNSAKNTQKPSQRNDDNKKKD